MLPTRKGLSGGLAIAAVVSTLSIQPTFAVSSISGSIQAICSTSLGFTLEVTVNSTNTTPDYTNNNGNIDRFAVYVRQGYAILETYIVEQVIGGAATKLTYKFTQPYDAGSYDVRFVDLLEHNNAPTGGNAVAEMSELVASFTLPQFAEQAQACQAASGEEATQSFLSARSASVGTSARPTSQRISRLNGQRPRTDQSGGEVLNYVSSFASTGQLPISASLSAIADLDQSSKLRGSPFDAWIEGTFSLLETQTGNGRATSAAIGADYLLTPDLLVGGFVSIDRLDNFETATDTFSGTGWMAGPYLTTRLTDQLYLDLTAGAGTAANKKSNSSGEDNFNSTRAYLNATLEGQFGEEAIRFTPRLGLNYAGEWAAGYTDHNGAWTDATSSTSGSVFAGPGVTFTAHDSDITRSLTLRADANTTLGDGAQLTAALEAAVQLGFANGVDLSARANWAGIGTSAKTLSLSLKASAGF
ncbi:autotransporter outer membrane beta-barrel domain-containing protein [Devosia sp. MC532]|uniref:autotransporter outer membrane beta-barrel domain-containing protein n=1 Tax=Devosia sp. MC532 TaxID=2799788 RepID=UPI0018F6BA27|nr:autotransporter outer membrane beta-barrel domain-containing protein [Devosia sp. MC532]MBJ7577745.1 autotransporter outer membrane beta-barrel domain-containing protein [Devosia sp. MC532]